jgi:REP element-mobilizing transposase RayT
MSPGATFLDEQALEHTGMSHLATFWGEQTQIRTIRCATGEMVNPIGAAGARRVRCAPTCNVLSGSFMHMVVRALPGQRPLEAADEVRWMMKRLRSAWPRALAACVMPNHLHLLIEAVQPSVQRVRLARIVAAFGRHFGRGRLWEPVPQPVRVPDRKHLQRTVRYVLLNPSRARLVSDPLCWAPSTLRGIIGAEFDPWVSASRLAAALGERWSSTRWVHAYVSRDPDAVGTARSFPRAAPPSDIPRVPVNDIIVAVKAATPWSSAPVRRHGLVLLAWAQGWRDAELLARVAGVSTRQIYRLAQDPQPALLAACALCLGDVRLRTGLPG